MANSPQARKRVRQAVKNRQHNASQRTMLRTYIKRVQRAVAEGDKDKAQVALQSAVPVIDRMAHKGLIHANKAARHKSRLSRHVNKLG